MLKKRSGFKNISFLLVIVLFGTLIFGGCAKEDTPDDNDKVETGVETDAGEESTFEADVLVVGAGFAGINAAIESADLGAKVILFEKTAILGGSINFAGGTLSGAGTKIQEENDIKDTPDLFYEDIERLGKDIFIPELTKKHIENSAAAIDWMDSIDADFGDRETYQPSTYEAFDIAREHRVSGGGRALLETVKPLLDEHISKGNIKLLLETEVMDIVIEDDAVVGVVAKNKDKEETYNAKSTILATGGYGHNEEWVNKYNFENALTDAPEFATGSGYDFAEKAGATFSNMDYLPAYPGGVPVSEGGFKRFITANTKQYPGAIWVNKDGNRMIDEIGSTPGPVQEVWSTAPENLVYIVFDEAMKQANEPILKVGYGFAGKEDEGWERFEQEIEAGEVVFKGDTLEELASEAGINPEELANTVKTYNEFVDKGEDTEFGRDESLIEFKDGPYYAVKTVPYLMLTKGGPAMNDKAQILNENNEPIEGLYQCGELIGGANIGGAASIGGLANTICIVWGKIAAQSAVEHSIK